MPINCSAIFWFSIHLIAQKSKGTLSHPVSKTKSCLLLGKSCNKLNAPISALGTCFETSMKYMKPTSAYIDELRFRVRITGSHFEKFKGIRSFCKALSQRKNENAKLSILCLAPKFHLVTIILKHDNVLHKHLISWHNLILQPPHHANFHAVYSTPFMFYALNFLYFPHSVSYICQITVECSSVKYLFQKYFYQCQITKVSQSRISMLLIFMAQCCFATLIYVQNWMSHEVTLRQKNFTTPGILKFFTVLR